MVKVGKSNNLKRVAYFSEAGYAGITDWVQIATFVSESNEAALALESMINAKLKNQGYLLPKIMWDDLKVPGRRVGATECYSCSYDHAIKVALQMSGIYEEHIAE